MVVGVQVVHPAIIIIILLIINVYVPLAIICLRDAINVVIFGTIFFFKLILYPINFSQTCST